MIFEYLLLTAFIGLVILGVHAVTRNGMLLSFLGNDDNAMQEMEALKSELQADLLKLQDDFHIEAMSIESDKAMAELASFYLHACQRRQDMYMQDIAVFQTRQVSSDTALQRLSNWLSKPLTECTTCMSSLWSIAILNAFLFAPFLLIIFVPFAVAGIIQLFEAVKSIHK